MTSSLQRLESTAKALAFWRISERRLHISFKWAARFMPNVQILQAADSALKTGYGCFLWPAVVVSTGKFCRYFDKATRGGYSPIELFRKTVTKTGDMLARTSEAILWTNKFLLNILPAAATSGFLLTAGLGALTASAFRLGHSSYILCQAPDSKRGFRDNLLRFTKDVLAFGLTVLAIGAATEGQTTIALLFLLLQTTLTISEYTRVKLRAPHPS